MELYRNSAVGISLVETLNALLEEGTIEFSTANHILSTFDLCFKSTLDTVMAPSSVDTGDLIKVSDGKFSTKAVKKEKSRKKTGKTKGEKLRNIGLQGSVESYNNYRHVWSLDLSDVSIKSQVMELPDEAAQYKRVKLLIREKY